MSKGLDVQCSLCGKVYSPKRPDIYRRQIKNGQKHFFCSFDCVRASKKFFKPKVNITTRKKISDARKGKWSKEKNPNYKGRIVEKKWEEGCYSNRDTSGTKNPSFIDGRSYLRGKDYRGSNWRSQKKKVLRRDGSKCKKCNTEQNIIVHHKVPYAITKDNSLDNLVTLCKTCHGKEHMVIGWNYFKKSGVTQ